MTKKRILALLLALCLCTALFAACNNNATPNDGGSNENPGTSTDGGGESGGESTGDKPKVTLWTTGSQNLSDMFNAAIAEYNALPDAKCTVELQFVMSGTGDSFLYDRLAAAYKSGQTNAGFDIIAENATSLANYEAVAGSDELFLPVDFSKIPNYENLAVQTAFRQDRAIPYRITAVVFAYDSERVPSPPQTWAELETWIKENPGRFTYNPPNTGGAGGAFVNTSIYRNLPVEAATSDDPAWMEQWGDGINWLKEIHPYLYQSGGSVVYPNKNQGPMDLFVNKEVDIIPAWADQLLQNIESGTLSAETTKMTQMSDKALSGTDVVFTFPSIGSNQEEAYDFVNFMLSPRGQQICLETIFAIPVIDPDTIDSDAKGAIAGLDVSNMTTIDLGSLGPELQDRWEEEIAILGSTMDIG